jgi:hypothetical protein
VVGLQKESVQARVSAMADTLRLSQVEVHAANAKEETERQSARAEMEDAIREHEAAKARLDALRRRE